MTKKEKEIKEVISKKEIKEELKREKKARKESIKNERIKIAKKIDDLVSETKATKDKELKKKNKVKINELRKEYKNVGKVKKDSFLNDVKEEMKLVRWPSKFEIVKYSLASLLFVLFFALFFYGIDTLFALVKSLIRGMI